MFKLQDWNHLRFRPNVVVENCRPFEEDTWKRIRLAQPRFARYVFKVFALIALTLQAPLMCVLQNWW
jgi:hypothetical protein